MKTLWYDMGPLEDYDSNARLRTMTMSHMATPEGQGYILTHIYMFTHMPVRCTDYANRVLLVPVLSGWFSACGLMSYKECCRSIVEPSFTVAMRFAGESFISALPPFNFLIH